MSKKHTNTCYDCIHLATCYKIEHFGRDLETNMPCDLYIGISDRIEVVKCKDCKHFRTKPNYCGKLAIDDVEEDFYCSYGERRIDNG